MTTLSAKYFRVGKFHFQPMDARLILDNFVVLSILLVSIFFLQYWFHLTPDWLLQAQQNTLYKQISGFALAAYLYQLWRLARLRQKPHYNPKELRRQHKRYGSIIPLIFLLHSAELGFGYQSVLGLALLANCMVGCLNLDTIRLKIRWYYVSWLVCHIGLAIILGMLTIYHLYIVYTY